jgi:hypothetical protein
LINFFNFKVESHRFQLNKLEQENEINEKKQEEFETRLNLKEREYISRRLTYEVYEEQVNKLLKQSDDTENTIDNRLVIERFQQDVKQLSKELPKLRSQADAIQTRIQHFQQRKKELIEMRDENKKLDQELQIALEDKLLKENYFNRISYCRDIIRNIYKCRTTNDLSQKIFYHLPVKIKDNEQGKMKIKEFKILFYLDDLSRASHIISKYIGRDWNRLYWQLPFHPIRGEVELSKDIKHIDAKYQRGEVFQVNIHLNLLMINSILSRIKQWMH